MQEHEDIVSYENVFTISPCVFNGDYEYQIFREGRESAHPSNGIPTMMHGFEQMLKAASRSTGVEYKIKVRIEGDLLPGEDELVSDSEIKKIIYNWNKVNLSMLPEFKNSKINTTVLAKALHKKLQKLYEDMDIDVEVREGDLASCIQYIEV